MIDQAVAAMMLVCAGNPLPSAKAEAGIVGLVKVPVDGAMLEKLRGEPPASRLTFIGETGPYREWLIGGATDANTGKTMLLRLTKSSDPLSPYAFRAGHAVMQNDSSVEFEATVEGKCDLLPANTQSKGLNR